MANPKKEKALAEPVKFQWEQHQSQIEAGETFGVWEYEVTVDCQMTGEVWWGEYEDRKAIALFLWDIGERGQGVERKLIFRVPSVENQELTGPVAYHGGNEVEEIAALLSLSARRRFRVGPITRIDNEPHRISFNERAVHPRLFDISDLCESSEVLSLAQKLSDEYKQRFALASRMYALALQLIETQTEQSFLNFVSAIEALSATYEPKDGTAYQYTPSLEKLLSEIKDKGLASRLRKELWKTSMATRKFCSFVLDHVESDFWESDERPNEEFKRIPESELEGLLKRIYAARSELLHNGLPVCPSVRHQAQGEELLFCVSMGNPPRWDKTDFIPHISFIERLVQHVLMNFLRRHQVEVSVQTSEHPESNLG